MWTTLALVAALSTAPAQADSLTFKNVRVLYALLGAERPDNKILPGDFFSLAFDIDGVKTDQDGRMLYKMGMEVTNSKGKVIYAQEPEDRELYAALGGNSLPATANVVVGLDQPAGEYTMKVTVTDRVSKAAKTITRQFEVLGKDFGLVRLTTSLDAADRMLAPAGGIVGESRWVHFKIVGFERNGKKQPDVLVEMRVLDENDQATLPKPFSTEVKEEREGVVVVPIDFPLALNRPGKFTIELQAHDRVSKKKAKVTMPVTVFEPQGSARKR